MVDADDSKPQTAREVMEREILPQLQKDPMKSEDCRQILRGFGVKSADNIQKARARLGIKPRKTGFSAEWWWCIGDQQPPEQVVDVEVPEGR